MNKSDISVSQNKTDSNKWDVSYGIPSFKIDPIKAENFAKSFDGLREILQNSVKEFNKLRIQYGLMPLGKYPRKLKKKLKKQGLS